MPKIKIKTRVSELLGAQEPLPIRLHGGLADMELELRSTALLCVDMQEHLARPRSGPKAEAAALLGLEQELDYYWLRLEQAVSNLQRLQSAFRQASLEVIHTMGGRLTRDGREGGRMKPQLRAGAWVAGIRVSTSVARGNPIVPELAPLENEVVIVKDGASAFGITRIDLVLRNLGIESIVVGGAITNQCVEATVRGAFDHDFGVILVDDACATYSEELRKATLQSIGDWFCKVVTTNEVLSWFAAEGSASSSQQLQPTEGGLR